MQLILRTALFGVTPDSLLLGRACCLADSPPVGLYDPDPKAALQGALFLGISARKEPEQLNPREAPLKVAIVGHREALSALTRLTPTSDDQALLVIVLFERGLEADPLHCQAVPDQGCDQRATAITASLPPLSFKLSGSEAAKREGQAYLQSLSLGFRFL